MIPQKGKLKFLCDEGWVIFTSTESYLRVHKDIISEIGLKKNDRYYQVFYHFNVYGDLCVLVDEHFFCLDKSVDYDIKFKPTF